MESGCSKKLLDLLKKEDERSSSHGCFSEEKKLELRLGPPGDHEEQDESSLHSFGYKFSSPPEDHRVRSVLATPWAKNHQSKTPSNTAADMATNCSQKRTAPGSVVGWPPIRSFRKNLATTSSSSKLASESQCGLPHKVANEKKPAVAGPRVNGLFVKINMDGVPIGRKVDLKAYGSYEKLSNAVDELFRGLLAAQRNSSTGGRVIKQEEEKPIADVLDGSGEYTLVYEDNEGDRMLVGDVPWHMFVSTVKRLRVLKSSELSAISLGSNKKGKMVENNYISNLEEKKRRV